MTGAAPYTRWLMGWLVIVFLWLTGLAAGEWLARRYGGLAIVDGRPVAVEPHEEFGGVTLEELGGVAVWRRAHPDRPTPKPAKEGFRIVVLGDSVLQPARVEDREGTARLLERELNERLDAGPYEVVNLAEGGWNTAQEEQVFLRDGLPLEPDLVLVGVTPNDIQEFAYRDGQLFEVRFLRQLDQRPVSGPLGFLAAHSHLYNLLWLEWQGIELTHGPNGPLVQRAIVEPLQRMAARTAQRGAGFAVLCFPFLRSERFTATDRCDLQPLVDWASQARVPLLDPIPAYAAYPTSDLRLDDIHLSPLGHRVLTQATFDWLVAERLVPYRRVLPAAAP